MQDLLNFIYSEKATKFGEIFTLLLSFVRRFRKILWPSQNIWNLKIWQTLRNSFTINLWISIVGRLSADFFLDCHRGWCYWFWKETTRWICSFDGNFCETPLYWNLWTIFLDVNSICWLVRRLWTVGTVVLIGIIDAKKIIT